jgi:DNA-binding MarR family transcriptional regulator
MSTELGMLLAAACERYVRTTFAGLSGIGFGHLTPSQVVTVMMVGEGVTTVTALAERQGMTTPAISKICTALEAEGLLHRAPRSEDARSRRLALTQTGTELLAVLSEAGRDAERQWAAKVGVDTLDVVRTALAAYIRDQPAPQAPAVRIRFG